MELYVCVIIFSIINIIVSTFLSNSILHPTRLFVTFWTILISMTIIFYRTKYEWDYIGLLWIEIAILFMTIGGILAKTIKFKKMYCLLGQVNGTLENICRYNWKVLIIVIIIGLVSPIFSLTENGFSINDVLSLSGIINVSSTSAIMRYSESRSVSTVHQIASIFTYACALCGGYTYNYAKEKVEKVLSMATMLPIILEMVFTSGKSGFIAAIILWIGGWCISYKRIHAELPRIKMKIYVLLLGVIVMLYGVLFLVMLLRTGNFSSEMVDIITEKFWKEYAFGPIIGFDAWFLRRNTQEFDIGSNTYMTLFRMIGLVNRQGGIYDVLISEYGNVFTVFRGVISDFGIIGGIIYCFFRGIVTQLCYNSIDGYYLYAVFPMMIIACSYFWNLYGFIVSPWVYTSYIMAIIVYGIFILMFHKIINVRKI